MTLRLGSLFIVGAIVLSVLALIATTATNLQSLGVDWDTWVTAALLAYFASLLAPDSWSTTYSRRQPPQ